MSEEKLMKLLPFEVQALQSVSFEIPYGINQLQAPEIWAQGEKGSGIVVAVLDTGIDRFHPDLAPNIIGGRNFTNEGSEDNFQDHNGHGTHCAGTIAGVENEKGVVGVAPEAKLLIGKVLNRHGSGSYRSIIDGIKWATNWTGENGEKTRVISMSLGGSYNDRNLEKAILEACAKGIVVVVASGNEGNNDIEGGQESFEYSYPALYNECITVGAIDENRKIAYFSNVHKQVDVVASGVDVLSTYPINQYARLSGTSMATPHVAGVIALLIKLGEKKFKRELTESELYGMLTKVCCSLGYEASTEGNGLPELTRFFEEC
jgi:major intracellular serine protease